MLVIIILNFRFGYNLYNIRFYFSRLLSPFSAYFLRSRLSLFASISLFSGRLCNGRYIAGST
jgi:hypothetical protein